MTRILIVDDDVINLEIMRESLESSGYAISSAQDGEMAWAMLCKEPFDVVILDRIMPQLDGLSLLKRIKDYPQFTFLPIIMQTAASKPNEVLEGMEAGAYYYLTKPYEPRVLRRLVGTILAELEQKAKFKETSANFKAALSLFEQGHLQFRTLEEARHIATALGTLCREESSTDIGLMELMMNAIEHGNLGISYAEKSHLCLEGLWETEIQLRLKSSPWSARSAHLAFRRREGMIEFTITDEGDGFVWQPYLKFDPNRAFDLNGRGIAMANTLSFVSLEYQGKGNQVVACALAAENPGPQK